MDDSRNWTLVTGASGLVGNNLVRALLSEGRQVRAFVHRNVEPLNGLDVEIVHGDLLDQNSVALAVERVSTVYHLAAAISIDGDTDQRQLIRTNVEGTGNVLRACVAQGVRRLVHFSSIHALSHIPKNSPIDETRNLATESRRQLPYDFSKAQSETAVLNAVREGLDAVVLNPVGIFGPYDFGPSPSGEFLLQLINGQLPALVKAGYYWVDARDVADAAIAAERCGRCGSRYILAGSYATFREIAGWISEFTGARLPRFAAPIWLARLAAPFVAASSRRQNRRPLFTPQSIEIVTRHQSIQSDKAHRELGFNPRPLRETIRDTVLWLQTHRC